jgi:hypothetical protein
VTIHEHLDRIACSHAFTGVHIGNSIVEEELSSGGIDISSLQPDSMSVPKDTTIVAVDMNDGDNDILPVQVQITKAISGTKSFPPVFEIANEVAMPDNAERISFAEFYIDFGSVDKGLLHGPAR